MNFLNNVLELADRRWDFSHLPTVALLHRESLCCTVGYANSFKKAYKWLAEMNLLPSNLRDLSQFQVRKLNSEISSINVANNKELFSMFYS